MAGVAGRSGAHNRLKHSGLMSPERCRVEQWPWMTSPSGWDPMRIFEHLADACEEMGVTRDQFATDAVRSLADNHWLRILAMSALQTDDKQLGETCAFKAFERADKGINAAGRMLGVYPYGSVQPASDDEGDDLDFH